MEDEDNSVVWGAIAGVLGALYTQMETVGGAAFGEFKAFGKKVVLSALAKVGWEGRASDGHTDKLLRATVIGLLDTFAWDDAAVSSNLVLSLIMKMTVWPFCDVLYNLGC